MKNVNGRTSDRRMDGRRQTVSDHNSSLRAQVSMTAIKTGYSRRRHEDLQNELKTKQIISIQKFELVETHILVVFNRRKDRSIFFRDEIRRDKTIDTVKKGRTCRSEGNLQTREIHETEKKGTEVQTRQQKDR